MKRVKLIIEDLETGNVTDLSQDFEQVEFSWDRGVRTEQTLYGPTMAPNGQVRISLRAWNGMMRWEDFGK